MEYDFNVVHQAGVKDRKVEELSRLYTDGTDTSDISNEITIMALATRAQKQTSKDPAPTPEPTHIEANEPQV